MPAAHGYGKVTSTCVRSPRVYILHLNTRLTSYIELSSTLMYGTKKIFSPRSDGTSFHPHVCTCAPHTQCTVFYGVGSTAVV